MMCGRCLEACPVGIDTLGLRIGARSVDNKNILPDFSYLLNHRAIEKQADVVYFAGCMGHLTPGVKNAMLQIFAKAGINYSFLDEDGAICCGRPLKLAGLFEATDKLVSENTRKINDTRAKILVTSCPICFKVFNNDYSFDGIEVMHHSVYIEKLITENKISLKPVDQLAVYHDPCELGRGSAVYDQPRKVLKLMKGLVESSEERENSLCCGGSIGDLSMNANQRNMIRDSALNVLCEHKPDILVTACPLCKKTFESANRLMVKDIAELVAENIVSATKSQKIVELVEHSNGGF
jgi:Fe-S oxidoreductase